MASSEASALVVMRSPLSAKATMGRPASSATWVEVTREKRTVSSSTSPPATLAGSQAFSKVLASPGAAAPNALSCSTASGRANCAPDSPATKYPRRTSPRISIRSNNGKS